MKKTSDYSKISGQDLIHILCSWVASTGVAKVEHSASYAVFSMVLGKDAWGGVIFGDKYVVYRNGPINLFRANQMFFVTAGAVMREFEVAMSHNMGEDPCSCCSGCDGMYHCDTKLEWASK